MQARNRTVLAALLAVLVTAVAVVGGLARLATGGSVFLKAPSAPDYAAHAITAMDSGLRARGPEWERARSAAMSATAAAGEYSQTWPVLARALTVAGGRHAELIPPATARVTESQPMPEATVSRGVTTLTLPTLTADAPPYTQQYADQLATHVDTTAPATTCGWLVDLRGMRGGDMHPVLTGLGPLLPDGVVAGLRNRNDRVELAVDGRALLVDGQEEFATYHEHGTSDLPVAVVQGAHTGGSGELAVIALTGTQRARSFGEPTAGHTVRREHIRLHDGTTLLLPTSVFTDAAGTPHEGALTPDEAVPVGRAHEAADAWLKAQCR